MPTSWDNVEKSGGTQGWEYDEVNLSYDQANDPESNSTVYYDSIGLELSITNQTKS